MLVSALTIGGLDPSGGAGIAADLRAFGAAGVWGTAVCAALTVQSTRGLSRVVAVEAALVEAQTREVLDDADVAAMKTGALGSAANARAVATIARSREQMTLVVDPVMVPSRSESGARLDGGSVAALRVLCAAATLVTPNLDEAGELLGRAIATEEEARDAAVALVEAGARAALVKGGHGTGAESVDWLATRGRVVRIATERRALAPVHGTGCTLASLIAGKLASRGTRRPPGDEDIAGAVRWARARLDRALARTLVVGAGMHVIDVRRTG